MNDITYVERHTGVSVSRHRHEEWELLCCTGGSGSLLLTDGTLPFRQGDVVVVPPETHHAGAATQPVACIRLRMVSPMLRIDGPTVITDAAEGYMRNAFEAACHHFYDHRQERDALLMCYGNLICCYLAAYQKEQPHSGIAGEIEQCIIHHYTDPAFKLDRYFSTLPFSSGYLRKLFQREFSVTPQQYLIDRRLQHAAEALLCAACTGDSVGDIALMCGFRDPLYFSKMFKKKYGVAPSQFASTRSGDASPDGPSARS